MNEIAMATTMQEFLAAIMKHAGNATGVGVVVLKGTHFTTHQFGMEPEDLRIASRLFREYSKMPKEEGH